LRIIAGLARGRRLFTPGSRGGETIRPTADRAREALFNILGREVVAGAMALDLFAGTGALGLEALSRGAREAFFFDHSPLALDLIHKNIIACGFSATAHVLRHDLLKGHFFWPRSAGPAPTFDLIFLDPPYRQGHCTKILPELLSQNIVGDGAWVICEDDSSQQLPERIASLRLEDQRAYGDTGFWFYHQNLSLQEGTA